MPTRLKKRHQTISLFCLCIDSKRDLPNTQPDCQPLDRCVRWHCSRCGSMQFDEQLYQHTVNDLLLQVRKLKIFFVGFIPLWYITWKDNKVRELATLCLPWQHWTNTLVLFDDVIYQRFTAVLLLIYGSLFLSGIY